jgi:hypothetical protein
MIENAVKYPEMRADLCSFLKYLSDQDYQQSVWVREEPREEWVTFSDAVSFLFDDTKLSKAPYTCIGLFLLNRNEADHLTKLISVLGGIFERHGAMLDDAAYIALPEWQQVIEAAQAAKQLICPAC